MSDGVMGIWVANGKRSCPTCHSYDGPTSQIHALCSNPKCSRVQATPANGCSAWEPPDRVPGQDDDLDEERPT